MNKCKPIESSNAVASADQVDREPLISERGEFFTLPDSIEIPSNASNAHLM